MWPMRISVTLTVATASLSAGASPPEYAIVELREIPSREVYVGS